MKRKKLVTKKICFLLIIFILTSCKKSTSKDYYEFIDSLKSTKVRVYYKLINNKKINHGKYISTNKKGKIIKDYNFYNGKLSGEQIRRFDNGILNAKVYYKNGLKNGYEIVYYESGNIKIQRKYNNNKLVFEEINYYENGNIENFNFYDYKGDLVSYVDFNKDGFIIKKEGILVHCLNKKNEKEKENTIYFEIMVPNIQNASRKLNFIYDDKRIGNRNLKKINYNLILVEEIVSKKGKNLLNVIVEYKFDKKYHNQVIRDTSYVEYFVK